MKKLNFLVLVLILVSIINSCRVRVPVTNRRQMNMLKESDLIVMADKQYREFLASAKILPQTDVRSTMVTRVGTTLKENIETYLKRKGKLDRIENFSWEFNTVDDATVNAWCMPGGKIVVYTGLLKLIEKDDELGIVLGHEIAHAIARHGNERMSEAMLLKGISGTFGALMGSNPTVGQQLFKQIFGLGAGIGMLKYSRKHETEADKIGVVFAKLAGYDPSVAIDFWKKMEQAGKSNSPEILSTHPSDEHRIKTLKEFIPTIDKYIK